MLISAYKVLLNKHNSTQQMKFLLRKHGTKIQTPEGEMNRSVENFLYENTVMNSFVSITDEVILSYQLTVSVLSHCFASNAVYKCFKTLALAEIPPNPYCSQLLSLTLFVSLANKDAAKH